MLKPASRRKQKNFTTVFYKCFPSLNSFATFGLRKEENKSKKLAPCEKLAHDCILGQNPKSTHLYFNYKYYLNELMHDFP